MKSIVLLLEVKAMECEWTSEANSLIFVKNNNNYEPYVHRPLMKIVGFDWRELLVKLSLCFDTGFPFLYLITHIFLLSCFTFHHTESDVR